jgi:hypothetical protein
MKTTNYDQFKLVKTNRPISKGHVKKLMESIKNHGYFNSKPITVNERMEISDGQHRFYACRELKIPINYEVDEISVNDSMIVLNSTSNVWRLDEYINHYAEIGVYCYIELRNLINQSNYGTSNCIVIYSGSGGMARQIRAGLELKKSKNITRVIEVIDFFKGKIPFYLSGGFIKGLCTLFKDNDIKESHIEKLKLNAFSIIQCATTEQYQIQFKKIIKYK